MPYPLMRLHTVPSTACLQYPPSILHPSAGGDCSLYQSDLFTAEQAEEDTATATGAFGIQQLAEQWRKRKSALFQPVSSNTQAQGTESAASQRCAR